MTVQAAGFEPADQARELESFFQLGDPIDAISASPKIPMIESTVDSQYS